MLSIRQCLQEERLIFFLRTTSLYQALQEDRSVDAYE